MWIDSCITAVSKIVQGFKCGLIRLRSDSFGGRFCVARLGLYCVFSVLVAVDFKFGVDYNQNMLHVNRASVSFGRAKAALALIS